MPRSCRPMPPARASCLTASLPAAPPPLLKRAPAQSSPLPPCRNQPPATAAPHALLPIPCSLPAAGQHRVPGYRCDGAAQVHPAAARLVAQVAQRADEEHGARGRGSRQGRRLGGAARRASKGRLPSLHAPGQPAPSPPAEPPLPHPNPRRSCASGGARPGRSARRRRTRRRPRCPLALVTTWSPLPRGSCPPACTRLQTPPSSRRAPR